MRTWIPIAALLLVAATSPADASAVDTLRFSRRESPRVDSDGFDRTLELQGIRFHVTSSNSGSINALRIVPAGLEDNAPIDRTIEGTVTGAEIGDLDADGSPECYVYVTSAGSGSYGSLHAYAAIGRRSLSEIHLPLLAPDDPASAGYRGHDAFALDGNVLTRRFPVYRESDGQARPTGGTRTIRYQLVPGRTGWVLEVVGVVDGSPRSGRGRD